MSKTTVRKIEAINGPGTEPLGDTLVLPIAKGSTTVPEPWNGMFTSPSDPVRVLVGSGDFKGDLGEVAVAYRGEGQPSRVLLVGMGDAAQFTRERLRVVVAAGARRALDLATAELTVSLDSLPGNDTASAVVEAAAEAVYLGTYRFDAPKASDSAGERALSVVRLSRSGLSEGDANAAAQRGLHRAAGTNLARDLGHTPANLMTPTHLAERAEMLASQYDLEFTVFGREEAERLGMGAFLGVTQGSVQPPQMIFLRYDCGNPDAPTVGLVGKGITFDSGGISLKPSAKMDEMKYDMCGAAAVLGTMSAVRPLGIGVNVIAAVAAAENMPSGTATKPGDVHTSYSGKTIEVLNTDAEGRLVLADALSYVVRNHKPAALLDYATLTGAVITALGHYGAAVLSNDDPLWQRIERAGETSGDRVWRLPIWEEMPDHLRTPFADLKNIADGNAGAGTIAAGAFLREFVEGTPWAHIDIAGTAWWDKDRPHIPKGASGYGVRLTLDVLSGIAG